jgi:hypothetical protein
VDAGRHLVRRVREAADDYRNQCRSIATDVVGAVLDAHDAGITREQIIEDVAAGMGGWTPK